jgi:hypothetical protein
MTVSKQRKRRQQRRRHHSAQSAGRARWKRRIDELTTDVRTREDAWRLVFIESALAVEPRMTDFQRALFAAEAGHSLLWPARNLDAHEMLVDPKFTRSWRAFAAVLDAEIEADCEEDEGPSPFRIAQRRMDDLAGWCAYAAHKQGRESA